MNNSIAKKLAFIGVMSASVFVLIYLETVIFKLILPITPAFFSIPLAISLSLYGNFKNSFVGGTILGCCSFICAFAVAYPIFYNPLISVLPRIIVGIVAYAVFVLCWKRLNVNPYVSASIAGALGVITNTVLVLYSMWLFDAFDIVQFMTVILSVNTLFELIGGIILTPIFLRTIDKFYRIKRTRDEKREEY